MVIQVSMLGLDDYRPMKVSLLAAVSADGFIAESSDQLADWTSKEDKRFFVSKTKEAGVLVMGRKTYDTIGRPLPGRLNVIMTRNAELVSPPDMGEREGASETLRYTSDTPKQIIESLRSEGFKEVVIAGGAEVYSLFMREGLVTDLFLTIEPVLFGGGVPLLRDVPPVKLQLEESKMLGEQAVLLHYTVL
jgi:dihydrofolate reductase